MTEKHKRVNSVRKLNARQQNYYILYIIIYMQDGKGNLNAEIEEI